MLGMYVWLMSRMQGLRSDRERGAAAVEYGLLVALIAVAIIVGVTTLGEKVDAVFCGVVADLPFGPSSCSG